jgi:hypothetical protein
MVMSIGFGNLGFSKSLGKLCVGAYVPVVKEIHIQQNQKLPFNCTNQKSSLCLASGGRLHKVSFDVINMKKMVKAPRLCKYEWTPLQTVFMGPILHYWIVGLTAHRNEL